ncbi:neural proliferation differentiation and control protein 1a isoform X2 [Scleropages formosus]|uniref:neural proliferation differentiation and control protein 1a isoform X2 n=1 Tax=Scleropages formosus TaxID=113540 RepID=UPI0010FA73D7|nr:neural proliferation differentiation and control protein 1-like isoform X2 [Scleropages formosus]
MLPLPRSGGSGGSGRTRVRAGALLCALLLAVSPSVPADKCPRLDCALEGRHFCQPGSSHCGPCLTPLVENDHGHCVPTKRHAHSSRTATLPELDEQIDLLSSIIAKQQEAEEQFSANRSPAPANGRPIAPPNPERSANSTMTAPPESRGNEPTTTPHPAPVPTGRTGPLIVPYPSKDTLFIVMISLCVFVGIIALILAAVCVIRLQKSLQLAQKVDYPAFGSTDSKISEKTQGDKNLAQSAQMYHYQHQKQQMLSLEKHKDDPKIPESGATSDEENEDGDFTVYECPGLAPTGEMEVKNPLFDDCGLHPQRKHK